MLKKDNFKNEKFPSRIRKTKPDLKNNKKNKVLMNLSDSCYRRLFETATDGLLILDADTGKVRDVNAFFMQMTGYTVKEILGKKLWDVGAFKGIKELREAFLELKNRDFIRYDNLSIRKKDGQEFNIEFKSNIYSVATGARAVQCNIRDITERKKLEETIRLQAFHDPLTNLPNRLLFNERFKQKMAEAKRAQKKAAILFLDLDHFKNINDTLGHATGDKLLKDAALRLKDSVRESDTVARIGGDEFIILLCDLDFSEETAIGALNILSSFDKPFVVDGHKFHISTSIGISVYPDDSVHVDELMRNADMAMYDAKENGRNTYRFFNADMNKRARKRMEIGA